MKDQDIREILISYLQAQKSEMRIYQEKSIGSSICDIMTVTDRLTGYEIKSDSDNYQRLPEQIRTYDCFFDCNYIVVGKSHLSTVPDRVPEHWGIICIEKDNVTVSRLAKNNSSVSRRAQLSILWKLELKNILIKNGMPLYAQREKGYIADRIAEKVGDDILSRQIAYELLHRDYSVFEGSQDYSIHVPGVSPELPARELIDTLSENDLDSFTLDKWIELYRQAREIRELKQTLFVKKPKEPRTEHEVPYTEIEVSLGAPWISKNIINEFIRHIINEKSVYYPVCDYEPVTGNWYVNNKRDPRWRYVRSLTVTYGTDRYNALFIIEASLNLREIRLNDSNGRYDEKETITALEKQKLIENEFREWIWADEDRQWEVEEAYNRMFSGYVNEHYDGSGLKFEDMSEDHDLYPYQKDAVQKILESKNTLLAFDVGAGKTYIMIAAAMKMRKEGISRRNMFVVPNHIVGQWEKIFTELYPKAKVISIEPKTFRPEMRQKALRQIKEGDYDGIIIAYSCFEMIPLSEALVLDNMSRQLKQIEDAIREIRLSTPYINWNRETLEKEKQRIKKMTMDFIGSMTPSRKSDITFGDLEISTLFLDEAHNYKNLPIKTRLKNLSGINTKGSNKCLDMLQKIRNVQNSDYGRGAVFATGTPLCNSISDAYAMQVYLQYEELEKSHLDQFDNWVKTFAKPEQLIEIDVDTSKYRMVRKFSRFHNLPELSRMFSKVAVFYAMDDDSLPRFDGYTDIVIEKYKELTDYMMTLCERTENIRNGVYNKAKRRKEKVNPCVDNMLKVSTDGRKAALDLQLVGEDQPYDKRSKVFNCVETVADLYSRYDGCTQLIFCDYSTPKKEDFNVYAELKSRLVDKGIPPKEIAFIHHYNTDSRKVELFGMFNRGEVRILIGSTFKLGIGSNVQVRLKAIHHLDVPWRPADMVQREGRIIRRGNENESILIYRYITEGSFDSYSWQILETKQRFISQFLSGSSYQRSIADLEDNVLTYAEVKALALSEPLMKQLAEAENEVKSLRIVVEKEKESLTKLETEKEEFVRAWDHLQNKRIPAAWRTVQKLGSYSKKEKVEAMKQLVGSLTQGFISGLEERKSLQLLCFTLSVPEKQPESKPYVLLTDEDESYMVEMGESARGNARRVLNFIVSFSKMPDRLAEENIKLVCRIDDLNKLIEKPDDTNRLRLQAAEEQLSDLKKKTIDMRYLS